MNISVQYIGQVEIGSDSKSITFQILEENASISSQHALSLLEITISQSNNTLLDLHVTKTQIQQNGNNLVSFSGFLIKIFSRLKLLVILFDYEY
jgi:hypothetical protein